MIDLYTFGTPNGRKASIMLEEIELPYTVHLVDIFDDQQFKPEFLKISPNNKIPAIVDQETGASLMESGAILMYLAQKTGKLMPKLRFHGDEAEKQTAAEQYWQVMQWLFFQVGGQGPMLGQAHHFLQFNPDICEYAEKRYGDEAKRLYGVMDRRLAEAAYLAGDDYSIADIAAWPWTTRWEWQGIDLNDYPNVLRWYLDIAARPAVQRGYSVPAEAEVPLPG